MENLIKKIANDVNFSGGKIYFVGGYVRDKLLGIDNKDIDVEIYGLEVWKVKEILAKYGKINFVGANFGIYKIEGIDIDFGFPRKENCFGKGHKDIETSIDPFISIEDACRRRDFTINSIMQDVNSGEFIDNFSGISDLKQRIIRHIDEKTFIEDPLRALRACQFASRFEFDIDEITIELCRKMDISFLSKERIFEEIKKGILKSAKPSIFIEKLYEIRKFEKIFFTEKVDIKEDDIRYLGGILDKCAQMKNLSNNSELFVFAVLIYGLNRINNKESVENLIKCLTCNKTFFVAIYNLIYEKIELDRLKKFDNISDYSLRKLAVKSIDRYKKFNIDDLLLLDKITELQNDNSNQILKNRSYCIGLNEERTVIPKYNGNSLKEHGIFNEKEYGIILKDIFDLQLRGVSDIELENYLNKYIYDRGKN